jgi:hypothetical protein
MIPPNNSITAEEDVGTMPAGSINAIIMRLEVYRFSRDWNARRLDST